MARPRAAPSAFAVEAREGPDALRLVSRSPHPYHRQKDELLHPSERVAKENAPPRSHRLPGGPLKESTPTSDSGTEADDEQLLKRLPAPKIRPHKGVRGRSEPLSGSTTPLATPAALLDDCRKRLALSGSEREQIKRATVEKRRRRKEIVRRSTELCLLVALGGIVGTNVDARAEIRRWTTELQAAALVTCALITLYPIRLMAWAYRRRWSFADVRLALPSSFDPAPLFYPPLIPLLVAFLVAANVGGIVLPNIILAISSFPRLLIPSAQPLEVVNGLHWLLSCLPLFASDKLAAAVDFDSANAFCTLPREAAVLLYPLHQILCKLLHCLTTTSLLPAELQLLSVALINLALASVSPQSVILQAVLWGGGLLLAVLCGQVIRWGISLARVPKWRFRRPQVPVKKASLLRRLPSLLVPRGARRDFLGADTDHDDSSVFTDGSSDGDEPNRVLFGSHSPRKVMSDPITTSNPTTGPQTDQGAQHPLSIAIQAPAPDQQAPTAKPLSRSKSYTPSGRRKRSASITVRAFFYLTPDQAVVRKWLYAGYVYACIVGSIFLLIRPYVGKNALDGEEPVGWALGYLFGDLAWVRERVIEYDLDTWICLPELLGESTGNADRSGWVQHTRHALVGEANTRLLLSGFWLSVLVVGLGVVFQLSPIYEVDTRRKVFHFMMVAMFLPTIFVDPAYAALALSLILAVFLLLDLLRASQLPPLSKPIASFLAPFVDGRDHRGPVVISHIFLLIGCAIPLWLSMAALPRTGSGYARGWEVPTRDVSMIAGVVCVGLGDAAASLIGRRWGYHKWIWGGGKSLEGSLAFAAAVFGGLMAASFWLQIGGWPHSSTSFQSPEQVRNGTEVPNWEAALGSLAWGAPVRKSGVCAAMASLTEAVLTGGNDNVVVPLVLWTCVKGYGL